MPDYALSPQHEVLSFEGPDAASFLQSQLTNDVRELAKDGDWQWQGYCNAKGRLYATFLLLRFAEGNFRAIVHASVSEVLMKRLMMFRLRAKLTIARDENLRLAYAISETAPATLADARWSCSPGAGLHWALVPSDSDLTLAQESELAALALQMIKAKLPEVVAATSEHFVPQMIGWDKLSPKPGVSFSKGCYPGQEVVARAHYRGAVKKHLEQAHLSGPAAPGELVTLPDGREAEVVNASPAEQGMLALVVTQSLDQEP